MSRPEVPAIAESREVNVPIEISIEADTGIVAARQQGKMLAGGARLFVERCDHRGDGHLGAGP